ASTPGEPGCTVLLFSPWTIARLLPSSKPCASCTHAARASRRATRCFAARRSAGLGTTGATRSWSCCGRSARRARGASPDERQEPLGVLHVARIDVGEQPSH